MMRAVLVALTLLMLSTVAFAEDQTKQTGQDAPHFKDAFVHDPSIIRVDDGTFYIYGSHMTAAKSQDLMNWKMISYDAKAGCTLVDDVQNQMHEALSWAKTTTFWAPDVERLKDGRYYLYYCCCEGSSPLSALGMAMADKPEGPFVDKGVFLRSGMVGIGESGKAYDATVDPNTIDPQVFHDKDGQLWMLYGSYSGGIFILKMDEGTGLPFPGQGYGKKLLGKNHSRIEGPYILYSPDTQFYYLFLSFGGLGPNDGYNIRVCRSKNPDGPYVDARGQDMINCGGPNGSFFDDHAIEPYGVKLMGGFRFMPLPNVTPLPEQAYKSPGHNSAYYDAETGRYFLIFHSRFSKMGDAFYDRVHQFWFNVDGWPVVSPLRYAGDLSDRSPECAGEYRLVQHERDINKIQHASKLVNFNADGTITGELTGAWSATTVQSAQVQLDEITYEGLFVPAYDAEQDKYVTTLTMLSSDGLALWGIRSQP